MARSQSNRAVGVGVVPVDDHDGFAVGGVGGCCAGVWARASGTLVQNVCPGTRFLGAELGDRGGRIDLIRAEGSLTGVCLHRTTRGSRQNELVSVGRIGSHREPERSARFVEACPADFDNRHAAVIGQPEEDRFGRVGRAHGDRVALACLLDAQRSFQVAERALVNALVHDEPGRALVNQAPRVERGLERIANAVDEALLMPAGDL
jgi:hypothetical protein